MAGNSLIKRLFGLKVLGASLGGAAVIFLGGIVAWGGFNTVMEATNTLDFCISCHEMEQTVYQEYKQSVHYDNRTGVRAICSDCHVPDPWVHKIVRKIQASNEILHKILGTINTPEKFEVKRPILAANEWRRMKSSDSRECRNCHSFTAMNTEKQRKRAGKQHEIAIADGQTCIDCHKGIAHRKPNDDGTPLPTFAQYMAQKAADEEAARKLAEEQKAAEEARKLAERAKAAEQTAPAGGGGGLDWNAIPARTVPLFYPGQTSWEWVLNGTDHGGGRAFSKGEGCAGCHEGEQAAMGTKMVTGEKAETTPIPGKPPAIPMTVQAAQDGTNLYMRFSWPAGPHTPAPFADGGKMDPENQVKLAMMIDQGKVEDAERSGCWSTCHHDARSMPDASGDKVTKYLPQSRTGLSIKDSPRGGADKLKAPEDLDKLLADGVFLDLLRWKSSGVSEDGHVLASRVMEGGIGAQFEGGESGGTWTVTMVRKLISDKPGDVSLEPGTTYTVGFAIHDDYTAARFHHVSVNYSLALDSDAANINAIKIAPPAAAQAGAPVRTRAASPGTARAPGGPDWSPASEKTVTLLYPGQTSWEWVLNGTDHGGGRAFSKGEACSGCHEGEQDLMGKKMASGQKAETTPIPGKRPSIPMTVKATHDAEMLYMRFSWPAGPHTPAPFVDGGSMDPDNQVKLALMIDQGKVEDAERSGCWSTCHHDAKSMPDANGDKVTKYLPQSRTDLSIKDSPRGGADKLKAAAELEKLVADGVFLDLLRWKSSGVSEDGYVSANRVMDGGIGATFEGSESGGTWTVTMARKLVSDKPGDVSLEPGKTYTVGFAIHDDHTNARYHHVSVDYTLALDNPEAAINVPAQ